MKNYKTDNFIKAWMRSVAGVLISLLVLSIMESLFLSLLTFIFLFFIPLQNERKEKSANLIIFGLGMIIILFFAFGFGGFDIGLGLDLGIPLTIIHLTVGGLLTGLIILKGFTSVKRSHKGKKEINIFFIAPSSTVSTILTLGIVLLFVLSAVIFTPWEWNSSAIIFTGIWIISFVGGIFSDPQTKQFLGVVMVLLSFVIFTLGIGSNIVGEATFGQYWPSVKSFGDTTIVPLVSTVGNFADSMKDGWRLLTCPTCVVQDIVEGRFGRDPDSGLSGAFGVEFTNPPRTTPIFPYTDYSLIMEVKNEGAADAENVVMRLLPGDKLPDRNSLSPFNTDKISLLKLGFEKSEDKIGNLTRQQSLRVEFESESPLTCNTLNDYKLESKVIPLIVELQYDYKVNSRLPVEVFDSNKWEEEIIRRGRVTEQKKPAELTNSPIKLNLDVGEQPKKEGGKIIVSLDLKEGRDDIAIKSVSKVVLHYPQEAEWIDDRGCKNGVGRFDNSIVWDRNFPETYFANCHFSLPKLAVPSTTFQFSAEAEYTVSTFKDFDERIEWRTGCCSDRVCSSGLECTWKEGDTDVGRCEPIDTETPTTPEPSPEPTETSTEIKFGDKGFCEQKVNEGRKCILGWGGCTDNKQCTEEAFPSDTDIAICRSVGGLPSELNIKVCCFPDEDQNQKCINEFTKYYNS